MRSLWILFFTLLAFYLVNVPLNDIWQPNEAFYAETAREILEKGDFLNLTYNYAPRLEKPPLTYWLTALSFKLFSVNEFSARLIPLLSTFLTVLLLGIWLRFFYSGQTFSNAFLLSSIIFLSSLQVFAQSRYLAPEMLLTFLISSSFIFYHLYTEYPRYKKVFLILSTISLALALLTKGIPFIAPFILGISLYHLMNFNGWKKFFKEISKVLLLSIIASIPILIWYIYCLFHYGNLFIETFYKEIIHRALNEEKPFKPYFYFLVILWAFFPFSLHFFYSTLRSIGSLLFPWKGFSSQTLKNTKDKNEMINPINFTKIQKMALAWFLSFIVLFTLAKGKIPVYILPAFPSMAVITSFLFFKEDFLTRIFSILSLVLIFITVGFTVLYLEIPWIPLLPILGFTLLALIAIHWSLRKAFLYPLSGILLLLYLVDYQLLPLIEKYRPYKELMSDLKKQYDSFTFITYAYFFKNFPFYREGKIYYLKTPQQLKEFLKTHPKAILIIPSENLKIIEGKSYEILKEVSLYTGSESRLIIFLKDIKFHRRFKKFSIVKIGKKESSHKGVLK
jgi:4-amino-4-deoxy-L-arabinose transferase-like glycosyltransferase